jgi:hypothetical protein
MIDGKRDRRRENPASAGDGASALGDASDTLEKAIADVPMVGQRTPVGESDSERLDQADEKVRKADKETKAVEVEIKRRKARQRKPSP